SRPRAIDRTPVEPMLLPPPVVFSRPGTIASLVPFRPLRRYAGDPCLPIGRKALFDRRTAEATVARSGSCSSTPRNTTDVGEPHRHCRQNAGDAEETHPAARGD